MDDWKEEKEYDDVWYEFSGIRNWFYWEGLKIVG